GSYWAYPNWSFLARILPYIEQDALFRMSGCPTKYADYDAAGAGLGRQAMSTVVKTFVCPSDPDSSPGLQLPGTPGYNHNKSYLDPSVPLPASFPGFAASNYVGVGGISWPGDVYSPNGLYKYPPTCPTVNGALSCDPWQYVDGSPYVGILMDQ